MDLNALALEELSRADRTLRLAEAAYERRINEAAHPRPEARTSRNATSNAGRVDVLRELSGIRNRRSLLARISAAGLAAVLAKLGGGDDMATAAKELTADGKKRKKKRCKKKRRCGKKRCCKRNQVCVGGACRKKEDSGQGTCPAGADSCLAGIPVACNGGNCLCVISTEGNTTCVQAGIPSACGACTSSADCAALGPGAFCIVAGEGCGCAEGEGLCALPCAS